MSKILTTNEGGPKFTERPYDPATPGPMAGLGQTPQGYIAQHATPEELKAFEKTIRDRLAKEPREVWEKCDRCGNVSTRGFRRSAGRPCFACNFHGEVGGGFYRDMIPAEIKAYQAREAKREAELRERMERAAFEARNDERRKHGLVPLTLEGYRAEKNAEWQRKRAADQELLDLARKLTKALPR